LPAIERRLTVKGLIGPRIRGTSGSVKMQLSRLRYSFRSLSRDPVFVVVVVLVLSLGIATNTTVFTIIDKVVLNPLPYRDPGRLVMIWESNSSLGEPAGSRVPAAWANFTEWRKQTQSFETIEAFEQTSYNLTGLGTPEHLAAVRATGGYFQMLGARAKLGRTLSPGDTRPGANAVVLITDGFSKAHFARGDAFGRKLILNGVPYTIVGILPKNFHLPMFFQGSYEYKPDIWVPMLTVTAADPPTASKLRHLFVSARLKPNISFAQARAEMTAVANRLAQSDPNLNAGYRVNLVPLKTENADPDLKRALYILWAAASVVLLLGCTNLASLMLVRAMNKRKDLAIMTALGAPRSALITNVLTEGSLLAIVTATFSILGSYTGLRAIRAMQPGDLPGAERFSLDMGGLLFTGLAFIFCSLIFALLPAWLSTRQSLNNALKNSAGQEGGRTRANIRHALVCGEVAIALVLAIGATLLVRSFKQLLRTDPGFRAQNILTARIALTPPRYATFKDRLRFCEQLVDRVRRLPEVQSSSLVDNFPLYSIRYTFFEIEGRPVTQPASLPTSDYANVTSDFFQTMGTPLRQGRLLTSDDMQDSAEKVVIVNEGLANKFWPNQNPIGSHIRFVAPHQEPGPWRRVIGVVGDFRQFNIDTLPRPEMFWPAREFSEMTLALKTATDPRAVLQSMRQVVSEIDKEQPLSDVQTLQHMVDHSIAQRRFNTFLLSGFAGLSIILALVGVYGLISYIISSQTRNIGIRLTLGAQQKHIFSNLILEILPFAISGVLLGLLFSSLTKKLIASLLFGVSALDPATYVILPIVLLILVFLTCLLPVWRAARVEPIKVLRHE
jgi:putative ABC transport system permease protein